MTTESSLPTNRANRPADDRRVVGKPTVYFSTEMGQSILGQAEDALLSDEFSLALVDQVDLIFTSPPFPLNRKKRYGNKQGKEYIDWLYEFRTAIQESCSSTTGL